MNSIRIVALLLLIQTNVALAQQNVVFNFTSDRPDSIKIRFYRDHVFDETSFGGGFKDLFVSNSVETVQYPNINAIGRLSLSSYSWPGVFIASMWIVEPGDSIHIHINFNELPEPTMKFSGRGSAKYQLAFDTRKLQEDIKNAEFELYDNVKTHKEAYQKIVHTESTLKAKLNENRKKLTPQVYKIWLVDIQSHADLGRLHILSHQWTVNPEARKHIRKELQKTPEKIARSSWYSSRALIQYHTELIKWKLLQERDTEYKHHELGYIQKYNMKDLFLEFGKLPNDLQQVCMIFTLVNYSTLILTFGETHPSLVTECLQMADDITSDPTLKEKLNTVSKKIKPGIIIEDLVTVTETSDTLKLSDFRGKKIILDLWGPRCSGCKDFRDDLVEYILPKIKNRNDIVIWSVGATPDKELWRSYLPTYCHPDFTSSWLKKEGIDSVWEVKYNASYGPFIMLVDEYGRLISSTVRKPETILALMGVTK